MMIALDPGRLFPPSVLASVPIRKGLTGAYEPTVGFPAGRVLSAQSVVPMQPGSLSLLSFYLPFVCLSCAESCREWHF